jgi:hypothetical protein
VGEGISIHYDNISLKCVPRPLSSACAWGHSSVKRAQELYARVQVSIIKMNLFLVLTGYEVLHRSDSPEAQI